MSGKTLRVNRRRGDDDFEIPAPCNQLLEITKQKIDVEAALVRLVDNQGVILAEPGVALDLGKQDAVCHEFNARLWTDPVLETHLVTNKRARLGSKLGADTRHQATGSNAAWLGVTDASMETKTKRETDFRQLRRLAGSRLPAQDHDLTGRDGLAYLVETSGDREIWRKRNLAGKLASQCHRLPRLHDGLFEFFEPDVDWLVPFQATLKPGETLSQSGAICNQAIIDQGSIRKQGLVMHGGRNCNRIFTTTSDRILNNDNHLTECACQPAVSRFPRTPFAKASRSRNTLYGLN